MQKRVSPTRSPTRSPPPAVLEINLGVLRYRTDDKAHAASLLFSTFLLVALTTVTLVQELTGRGAAMAGLTQWLCSTFLFVVSVAIGRIVRR